MTIKRLSIISMSIGTLIYIASVVMGYLGFPHAGFGWRKIALGVFGLLLLIVGVILFFWKKISIKHFLKPSNYSWVILFVTTFCIGDLYIFSEWLFNITKPSALGAETFLGKIAVLFFTSAVAVSLLFIGLVLIYFLSRIRLLRKYSNIFKILGSIIPTMTLSAMILLLFDNFTFTIFGFGIVDSEGLIRLLYLVVFIFLFIYVFIKLQRILSDINSFLIPRKQSKLIIPTLTVFVVLSLVATYQSNKSATNSLVDGGGPAHNQYPNIILITGDGVNASHMSVYGYQRETSPRLKDLAPSSLVAENAFPNANNTTAALLSFLTSKYSTETRVLYPPNILRNEDAYQHLPGILKSLGYYTAQFSYPYYADAFNTNMLSGFDYANGRSIEAGSLYNFIENHFSTDYSYFVIETINRILDRVEHIFFIKSMDNQSAIIQGKLQDFGDQTKIDDTINILSVAKQPVFIQLHWMGTHGPKFDLQKQVFSAGENMGNQRSWNVDFYDDSILEFDDGIGQIIDFLKSKNLYENTIIIVSSDHDQQWGSTEQIPLLIHFPDNQFSGIRIANIQQIDVAPTLLAYMGIPKPSWMQGDSFLLGELPDRPIFSASPDKEELAAESFGLETPKPPFYQFGSISVVYCDSWLTLQLESNQYQAGLVGGLPQTCNQNPVSDDQLLAWIIQHLKETGFDTSKIDITINK